MGDSDGNVYRLEGTGESGDAGTSNIKTRWRSRLFSLPEEYLGQNFQGYLKHKVTTAENVTVRILQGGSIIADNEITVGLVPPGDSNYFNDAAYFGGEYYFGTAFENRFARKPIIPPGAAEDFQIEVEYEGTGNIEINEIAFRFEAAN